MALVTERIEESHRGHEVIRSGLLWLGLILVLLTYSVSEKTSSRQ